MDLSIRFLILVLLGLVLGGSAQVSQNADLLLNQTEASLRELVNQVQANDLNSCDLLSACNAESTCSRLSCPLTNANTAGYACQGVLLNSNCKDNCPWRNFDFSRSFLRVPGVQAVTDEYITQRQLQGICAQRKLDNLFQKHSNNTNFFRLYFGSVDGTFRIFPGMDEANCSSYDPRLRLWYLTSTTNVNKAVMVLIDSGSSMAKIIPATSSDSNLATAFGVTEFFLNTTTQGDFVNVFTFDQAKVAPFSAQPVLVTDTSSHPDFGVSTATLSTLNPSPVPPGNITDAISEVITSSAGFGNSEISSEYLKVIILITDSNAVDAISNAALPLDLIRNNSISVFLYMFPTSTAITDYTSLASQLCAARGNFQKLDDVTVVQNPLLALEAYFSFVANVHAISVNNGTDYSVEFSDFSEVDNKTFTLSKAVFSNNGDLLGVVAINIFKTKLLRVYGIDGSTIEEAVRNRTNNNNIFNISTIINTTNCFNQAPKKTCNEANISNIVCSSNIGTDNTTLRKLSCCGKCIGADKPPDLRLALGLGSGLLILALAGLGVIAGLYTKKQRPKPDEFSGDDDDDVRRDIVNDK